MASPFPFTSGQVLTAAQLNSIGEATAFTPSWTNLTPGNATESWYYVVVNELLIVSGNTQLGSTSSVGTAPSFDFPVGTQVTADGTVVGMVQLQSSSVITLGRIDVGSSKFRFFVENSAGTYLARADVTATQPFTWVATDRIKGTAMAVIS